MAQSVKLSDGSYIDASAVYDTNAGKTQQEVNSSILQWKYAGEASYNAAKGTTLVNQTLVTIPTAAHEVMLYLGLKNYSNTPESIVVPTSYLGNSEIRVLPVASELYAAIFNAKNSKVTLVSVYADVARTYVFYIYYR